MFQDVRRRFFGSGSREPVASGPGDCDVLIPVFNRPDMLRTLLARLAVNTDRSLLRRIWIGDDGSDSFSTAAISRLAKESGLPITIIRHETSLGFGGNCNALFAQSDARLCIILNTDIDLPPQWLPRMLAPFSSDARIALATPLSTNAANHTLRLRPGQHWMEADRLLANVVPAFPDDCTAIGFCMAVHAALLRENAIPLFDPIFGRGYGEDTDLHYRVLAHGLRSVIIDDLLVHHKGAASFSVLPDAAAIRMKGESRLQSRWGKEHALRFAEFQARDALGAIRDRSTSVLSLQSTQKKFDILFVLPNNNLRYGGIWLIVEIVQALIAHGLDVGVFVVDPGGIVSDTAVYGFSAFNELGDLFEHATAVSCIVSTSDRTIEHAQRLCERYGSTEVLLLQNMEAVFRSGCNVETFFQYRRIRNVLTVSECLTQYIQLINPDVNVKQLRVGPDPLVFYPRDVARRPFTVALAANLIPEKGTTQALELALMLRERGFHFTIFGWDTKDFPLDASIGDVCHDTSRQGLAHLFSHTEFIIDQSYLEGLGLPPIEAAFCGCIPIIGSRGAGEYIFRDSVNAVVIDGYKDLESSLRRVQRLTPQEKNRLQKNAMKLRSAFNLEIGLQDAVKELSSLATSGPTSYPLHHE